MNILGSAVATSLLFLLCHASVPSFAINVETPVSRLLEDEAGCIALLKAFTRRHPSNPPMDEVPFNNDVFYLRYCMDGASSEEEERLERLKATLDWRDTDRGRLVTRNARLAYTQATTTSSSGPWNNTPVQELLPHHPEIFSKYMTEEQVLTTSTDRGDLLYLIRSRSFHDKEMMNAVTKARTTNTNSSSSQSASELAFLDVVDWFLYSKEVNSLLAHDRSLQTDRLVFIITLNDLHGASMMGGDARFQKALKESGKLGNEYYIFTFGPIVLLNLPKWLGGLANLFTPSSVQKNLKFHHGLLKATPSLADVSRNSSIHRTEVMEYLNANIYL